MKKTVLAILASVALTGTTIGAATAHERHHVRAYRTAPVAADQYRDPYAYRYRDSYAWLPGYPDYGYLRSHLEGGVISAPAGQ
ncbi:hypothetical protein [Bradyrhizobium sp. Tv2a-2]|uniref:hypothetical protein n=1 Tax=Bradyrhizobium sp. Tv2a-2 TaxID=113395 RepID=UPI0004081AD7|nr:hypothetical protein [Bradyrhizobium sp. Tv2a-2]